MNESFININMAKLIVIHSNNELLILECFMANNLLFKYSSNILANIQVFWYMSFLPICHV